MMMRADKYKIIGGLNENIEFYGEEPEFGYRSYKRYGYKTWFYPDAEITHLGGVSIKKVKKASTSGRRRNPITALCFIATGNCRLCPCRTDVAYCACSSLHQTCHFTLYLFTYFDAIYSVGT